MTVQSRLMAPAVLGIAAISTSAVLLVLQIVLALPHSRATSPTRTAAIIATIFQSATLALLFWVVVTSIRRRSGRKVTALVFGCGMGLCVVAAALTVATLICLSSGKTLGTDTSGFLAGTAIILVVAFPFQSIFLVSRFIADRRQHDAQSNSPGMQEIGRRSPTTRVKTVPYSRVSPPSESATPSRTVSISSRSPPGSSDGFSATNTIYSMASSVGHVVRSASSKTRLLSGNRSNKSLRSQRSQRSQHSQRSVGRAASMESVTHRERTSTTDDSFDSWDTSGVDPQNRQLVLETSSPVGGSRFLETIPASPTTSRSPSPGTPLDFDMPRAARRSRSFSPASARSALPAPPKRSFTQQSSVSEGHIHPLFRSDSPTPPPMASPGTIVIAAPQAGQIISDRTSIRSLSRMRSGSLPAVSSPLTNNGSFESFSAAHHDNKTFSGTSDASGRSDETGLGEVLEEAELPERKITPPVPDYILNAGSQTSLHVHPPRKTVSRDGPRGPGLEALPAEAW